jgi:hypothetical protein
VPNLTVGLLIVLGIVMTLLGVMAGRKGSA